MSSLSRFVSPGTVLLALASLVSAQEGRWIHYDGVEDGRLTGGRIEADPSNPLHVPHPTAQARSSSTVTTIIDNGPSSNRLDIVVVGDGYQAGELGVYAVQVDAVMLGFFQEEPFAEYANFFNVHRVDVVSLESGVDNDPQGTLRNTALDMTFWCGGIERLLCVDLGKAQAEAAAAPAVDQIMAVANSAKYGGAGYTDLCTLSNNSLRVDLALHEFGHSFGNLADEYWSVGTTYTGGEPSFQNLSALDLAGLVSQQRKWYRWINAGTPGVGAFEGGGQYESGMYRPTNNSLMRSLGRPYQEINVQSLIAELYNFVDPIDGSTPEGIVSRSDVLSVTPLHPVGHALDVAWSLDGAPIPGATGETLDLATLTLTDDSHVIEVEVVDNTPWLMRPAVRANRMTSRRTWTIANAATAVVYGCGLNPAGSLVLQGGAPTLGGAITLGVTNPGGFHPAGSIALVGISLAPAPGYPCGVSLAGFGMSPGQPGELLFLPAEKIGPYLTALHGGPGTTTSFLVSVPNDTAFLDLSLYAQGILWDPNNTNGVRFGLADAADLRVGL